MNVKKHVIAMACVIVLLVAGVIAFVCGGKA